ncbi:major paralogous domain-containing protein, partial [Fibrobacter sp. UWH9]|uniref:fibrobacter succinogenes major paralogous domain-containing protein n=1 Tax=Fibrobacter sp. UWH9 TaxID=1896213 RepID=UPI00091DB2D0
ASEKCPNKFDYSNKNEKLDGYINFLQHQGICPDGWHVMNEDVWTLLSEMSGSDVAYYMGSKVAGFGSNDYGLSILPTGYWIDYGNEHNKFDEIKVQSQFWMPQQADTDLKAYMTSVSRKNFSRNFPVSKKYGNSIRCVKNY